ncbi:MAG: hypothetical protein H6577_05675 [Lewinellaceae bacterium]|nr:hypothetical protein [Saprospiraceae bacterium]MCB9337595.1 hypothetical protein [Lewinellaceae bacterium]
MDKRATAKINMFTQVDDVLTANQPIVDTSPAFQTMAAYLHDQTAILNTRAETLSLDIKGFTENKITAKQTLSELLVVICGGIKSYAKGNSDMGMYRQANFAYSTLMRKRDTELLQTANAVHNLASQYAAEIVGYNVTNADLLGLKAAIDKFKADNPKPRSLMINAKTERRELYRMVDDLNDYLRFRMDNVAATFRKSHPDFFKLYTNARRNYSEGIRHRQPEGGTGAVEAANPLTATKAIVEQPSTGALLQQAIQGLATNGAVPAGE